MHQTFFENLCKILRGYEPLFIRIKESEALNNLFFKGFVLEYGESYEEFSKIYLFVTVCVEHSKHVFNYHGIWDSVAHLIADSNNHTKLIIVYHAVIAFETGDLLRPEPYYVLFIFTNWAFGCWIERSEVLLLKLVKWAAVENFVFVWLPFCGGLDIPKPGFLTCRTGCVVS